MPAYVRVDQSLVASCFRAPGAPVVEDGIEIEWPGMPRGRRGMLTDQNQRELADFEEGGWWRDHILHTVDPQGAWVVEDHDALVPFRLERGDSFPVEYRAEWADLDEGDADAAEERLGRTGSMRVRVVAQDRMRDGSGRKFRRVLNFRLPLHTLTGAVKRRAWQLLVEAIPSLQEENEQLDCAGWALVARARSAVPLNDYVPNLVWQRGGARRRLGGGQPELNLYMVRTVALALALAPAGQAEGVYKLPDHWMHRLVPAADAQRSWWMRGGRSWYQWRLEELLALSHQGKMGCGSICVETCGTKIDGRYLLCHWALDPRPEYRGIRGVYERCRRLMQVLPFVAETSNLGRVTALATLYGEDFQPVPGQEARNGGGGPGQSVRIFGGRLGTAKWRGTYLYPAIPVLEGAAGANGVSVRCLAGRLPAADVQADQRADGSPGDILQADFLFPGGADDRRRVTLRHNTGVADEVINPEATPTGFVWVPPFYTAAGQALYGPEMEKKNHESVVYENIGGRFFAAPWLVSHGAQWGVIECTQNHVECVVVVWMDENSGDLTARHYMDENVYWNQHNNAGNNGPAQNMPSPVPVQNNTDGQAGQAVFDNEFVDMALAPQEDVQIGNEILYAGYGQDSLERFSTHQCGHCGRSRRRPS